MKDFWANLPPATALKWFTAFIRVQMQQFPTIPWTRQCSVGGYTPKSETNKSILWRMGFPVSLRPLSVNSRIGGNFLVRRPRATEWCWWWLMLTRRPLKGSQSGNALLLSWKVGIIARFWKSTVRGYPSLKGCIMSRPHTEHLDKHYSAEAFTSVSPSSLQELRIDKLRMMKGEERKGSWVRESSRKVYLRNTTSKRSHSSEPIADSKD